MVFALEFVRTVSRLIEMQSHDHLARGPLNRDDPYQSTRVAPSLPRRTSARALPVWRRTVIEQ